MAGVYVRMRRLLPLARCFFALGLLGFGIQQVITLQFIRLVPGFPAWIPWPGFWAAATGLLLIAAGGALLVQRKARPGGLMASGLFLLLFLGLYVPQIVGNPMTGYIWTNPFKSLTLCGAALSLAYYSRDDDASPRVRSLLALTRPLHWLFLAVFLLICGVQHFDYADFVDTLVPKWIPPSQRFWTDFAGAALIAGGAGLFWPKTRRLAGILSGIMIFLWVLLLHIPRAVELKSVFELDGVFEATAISGAAFLIAAVQSKPATVASEAIPAAV